MVVPGTIRFFGTAEQLLLLKMMTQVEFDENKLEIDEVWTENQPLGPKLYYLK